MSQPVSFESCSVQRTELAMTKSFIDRGLRFSCRRGYRRAGFSLAELVVSLGILVMMMGLAGQVMNITVQSTGQAKAITQVNQSLRAFERSLREDLRHVNPRSSIMVIQANPINAYWTQASLDADDDDANPMDGYPHPRDPGREDRVRKYPPDDEHPLQLPRADMLMFFTKRPATSYVRYRYKNPSPSSQKPLTSNDQLVVYGHADLGEYVLDANEDWIFERFPDAFPDLPEPSPVPAANWHLARRSVLMLSSEPPAVNPDSPEWLDYEGTAGDLDDKSVLLGKTDVYSYFKLGGGPTFLDLIAMPYGEEGLLAPDAIHGYPWYLPEIFKNEVVLYKRSLLAETPPPQLVDRLGHYFLSRCASFKVEWTLDPDGVFVNEGGMDRLAGERELFWFDQGDLGEEFEDLAEEIKDISNDDPFRTLQVAFNVETPDTPRSIRLQGLLLDPLGGPNLYGLQQRFAAKDAGGNPDGELLLPSPLGNDDRPNTAIFAANRRVPDPSGLLGPVIPDDIFPKALRITIDLFDDNGRLDRPIRHVMVIPIGG